MNTICLYFFNVTANRRFFHQNSISACKVKSNAQLNFIARGSNHQGISQERAAIQRNWCNLRLTLSIKESIERVY